MPNAMAALPNIGGALCSTPQSLADAYYFDRFLTIVTSHVVLVRTVVLVTVL